jgi:hypothetical protein
LGIIIELRVLHPRKASLPILVTLPGTVIELRAEHRAKAELPIDVTESAMFTAVTDSRCPYQGGRLDEEEYI